MTLQAMYWVTKIRIFWKDTYVPNKCSLKDLDIEQSSILIEESLEYAKKIRAPVEITAREMKDLYESWK